MQATFSSQSAIETEAIGAQLAAGLTAGDIVLIEGELGAGKTTLVRGAARALGVTGPVTSPTFTIGQRYPASPVAIAHLDLYRIRDLSAEDPDLLSDYLGRDTIAFVEWPPDGSSTRWRRSAARRCGCGWSTGAGMTGRSPSARGPDRRGRKDLPMSVLAFDTATRATAVALVIRRGRRGWPETTLTRAAAPHTRPA